MILVGNVRETLKTIPDGSVHCVVTSPPYWGLRDYGTADWEGGDPSCDHNPGPRQGKTGQRADRRFTANAPYKNVCAKCGAHRIDSQIGLEPSPDCSIAGQLFCGECHVCVIREVFREVRRVLRDDGTMWLNYGDSYNANTGNGFNAHSKTRPHLSGEGVGQKRIDEASRNTVIKSGLSPKSLVGIPWRVALALHADGWTLRQDIIWSKPSPMPESITDRCTKAHEYLFLFTKSPRYYYDAEAIRERAVNGTDLGLLRGRSFADGAHVSAHADSIKRRQEAGVDSRTAGTGFRNKRSVWTVASEPYNGAHFATFPTRLIEPCIKAGTSERGCCQTCGAPWKRITSRLKLTRKRPNELTKRTGKDGTGNFTPNTVAGIATSTLGWEPTCTCEAGDPVPCTVFDPFMGSGTTIQVARHFGRRGIGCELNEKYVAMAKRRIETPLDRKGTPLKTLVRIERALPEDGELPIVTETDSVAALKRLGFKDVRDQWNKGKSGSQPFCLVCYGPHPLQNVAARVVEIPPLSDPLWTEEALQKLASRLREGSADLDVVLTGPGEVRFRRLVPF